jgi:hypothetical protein
MTTRLKLYKVTLPWDANDPTEGDFCENVWAKDADAAIKALAGRMADETDLFAGRRRKEFIAGRIDDASHYAAVDVALTVRNDIEELLSGPGNNLGAEALRVHSVICDLLTIYEG